MLFVSWTPTGRPEGYTIYYRLQGSNRRFRLFAGPNDTSVTIRPSFVLNLSYTTYFITIVATTGVPSKEVGPVNITARTYIYLLEL